MVGTYDETTDRSYPDYPGGTSLQRWHRDLLRDAMESKGTAVYEAEWWHFDYKDWRSTRLVTCDSTFQANFRSPSECPTKLQFDRVHKLQRTQADPSACRRNMRAGTSSLNPADYFRISLAFVFVDNVSAW